MYILTSSTAPVATHMYENYLKERGLKSVLFVNTAAQVELNGESENDKWYYDDLASIRECGYEVTECDIAQYEHDKILEMIDAHDILYMSGGNTFYMLQELQRKNLNKEISKRVQAGKVYIGTSTGSIIAGPTIEPIRGIVDESLGPNAVNTKGLGLVNFTVLPHWGDRYFKQGYLSHTSHRYDNCKTPMITLTDAQYIVVNDDGSHSIVAT